jgi:HEAT repeats
MSRRVALIALLGIALAMAAGAAARPPVEATVADLVARGDDERVRALGPDVLPVLVRLYRAGDPGSRAHIANLFYWLGWKSEEARTALMEDVRTDDPQLRLQVQWALGRVSNDDTVVDTLLDVMLNDPNPLFRDKAACGLADDQIHLTEEQKVRLYGRLIDLLESPTEETRRLAGQILYIHVGQAKGFRANFPPEQRARSVARWRQWLEEYRSNL